MTDIDNDNRLLRKDNVRLEQKNKQFMRMNELLMAKNGRLEQSLKTLREEFHSLKMLVEEYRQMLFKKKRLKDEQKESDREDDDIDKEPKKKGAPKGHIGKTREIPDRVDEHQDIYLSECPQCHDKGLNLCDRYEDHYQEDIIIPQTKVTRFRHHYYYCGNCGKSVHGIGAGEVVGSYIGPNAKSLASFLHYQMSISYRKIQVLFKEAFNMEFDPSSCVGFDKQIRSRGQPLYEKMKESLKEKSYLHIDETGWSGEWLWCYTNKETVVYVIDSGRGQKEIKSVLGDRFNGVIISDFLSAYNKITSRKQRCLVHLLRLIKKWHKYFDYNVKMVKYFTDLKEVIKQIIGLSKSMDKKLPENFSVKKADLIGRLRRLLNEKLKLLKADKFRRKLLGHFNELVTCLDFTEVCSHNNLAERMLRGNVIMRKITFGNRSEEGALNHEVIMSLLQTARLQKLNPLSFLRELLTNKNEAISILSA